MSLNLSLLRKRQRGDTIVEVMIVLAVLGLAISISYSIANRSLQNARQAQESAYATMLAASQVEQLRLLADNTDASQPTTYIYIGGQFCIGKTNHQVTLYPAPNHPDPQCVVTSAQDYTIEVKRDPATDTFTVMVTWNDISGEGQDISTLAYRVHKPS